MTTDTAAAIFVVGASRSGTALLRSALNRHPQVFLAGETHYFDDLRTRLPGGGTTRLEGEDRIRCEDYFLALSHRPYGHGGDPMQARMDRVELRAAAQALGATGDAYFEAYCKLSRQLEPDASPDPTVWGEKTPRHVFRLQDLLTRYPGARAVCIYRDPRAVVASYRDWRNQGGFDLDADTGHREALAEEESRTMASYDPTIASLLWKATVSAGHRALAHFGGERVHLVRYEDLALRPEETLEKVAGWAGLEFRPSMLEVPLHNSSFSGFSRSAGVSTAPVERWRSVLSPGEIAVVQMWCKAPMRALGFPLEPVSLSSAQRAGMAVRLPLSFARAAAANRHRMGKVGSYVWRRASLLVPQRRG